MVIELEYYGTDYWSRPVFKKRDRDIYFGSVDTLVPNEKLNLIDEKSIVEYFKENPKEIVYFGTDLDDDPNGGRSDKWKYKFFINNEEV